MIVRGMHHVRWCTSIHAEHSSLCLIVLSGINQMIEFPNLTIWQSSVLCHFTYECVTAKCVGTHVGVPYAPLHPFAHDAQQVQC